jgi:undecaprenyl diphosphate synthase
MSEPSATTVVPQHIGFILDGNRRWAKERGMLVMQGHQQGYETLKVTVEAAFDKGVRYVSAYVFSTENWNRTHEEVGFLMSLTLRMVTRDLKEMHKKGIRIIWLGSPDRVSEKLVKSLREAEEITKDNTKGTLAVCFNYGGQKEIVDAVANIVASGVVAGDVTEELIAKNLYGADVPPVDLLVRTSGEQRISNFMLWRAAYSELLFVDKQWPDFSEQDLDAVIAEFSSRQRRFGA